MSTYQIYDKDNEGPEDAVEVNERTVGEAIESYVLGIDKDGWDTSSVSGVRFNLEAREVGGEWKTHKVHYREEIEYIIEVSE